MCPQELTASQNELPAPAIRQVGYGAIWHGQKSWSGVVIPACRIRLETAADNALYVCLMQEEGHLAWPSPIYVFR